MLRNIDTDIEIELPQTHCLNSISAALRELGMLGPGQISHRQVLRELHRKPNGNGGAPSPGGSGLIRYHSGYVSNVAVCGLRLRPVAPPLRYRPYAPVERHRTRSENNDGGGGGGGDDDDDNVDKNGIKTDTASTSSTITTIGHTFSMVGNTVDDLHQLKKAKSLESIVMESGVTTNATTFFDNIKFTDLTKNDLEIVSDSISNLKVNE